MKKSKKVFVGYLEPVLEVPSTGSIAQKILHVEPRFLWYPGYDTVVLHVQPDSDFLKYVSGFKKLPKVVVPEGLNLDELRLVDGFAPGSEVEKAIQGADVGYYISDPHLYQAVTRLGGNYIGGKPNARAIEQANDKELYKLLLDGSPILPVPGTTVSGIMGIGAAVAERIMQGKDAFVRIHRCGGGLGNKIFRRSEMSGTTKRALVDEVVKQLRAAHSTIWENAHALVEEIVDLSYSPGAAFHTDEGLLYDFLQVTRNGDYTGFWSPVHPFVCQKEVLSEAGDHLAEKLRGLGFHGDADTDLGITADGRVYGFEINGRMDGVRHGIEVGVLLHGPWSGWREKGIVAKGMDDFHLNADYCFAGLLTAFKEAGVPMATKDKPWGVVLTIPPLERNCGLLVVGRSYDEVARIYTAVNDQFGDLSLNVEDHPLPQ